MSSNLLIVESPSKAKTLKKYLGRDFEILASFGHVRDLVPKQGAVDTAHGFAMKYQLVARNHKHVDAIAKAVAKAGKVFLATDPDREGEAIAWHIAEILRSKNLLKNKPPQRVVFYEITESAVKSAIKDPREISMALVNAQQARRALDYLVGFNLSPLLWRKIRPGLSAGRVQSPALRLIVEREQEIETFHSQEYWTIHLDSHKEKQKFSSRLVQYGGEKLEQFTIGSESAQQKIIQELSIAKEGRVAKVDKKSKQRSPAPPFTTSTLQQEAVRKLNMTTGRTMRVAQQLYEGVDLGGTSVGLITYMRTDSFSLANEAIAEIRDYVRKNFESEYLPKSAVHYKSKSKNVQEAHEAIRPTSIFRTPESVRHQLSTEQARLYEMIWKRTLACQISPAKFDVASVDINVINPANLFRASGQTLVFPGFIAVYQEEFDEQEEPGEGRLPELHVGDVIPIDKLYGEQHFTQPPPRYTEASLVKTLEEHGIGRPSTYATIISTLLEREYVVLDKKHFLPTDVGRVVNKFLTEHFTRYVDYDFTAKLEDELDLVSTGKRNWIPLLEDFWKGFNRLIEDKKNLSRREVTQEQLDEVCPKCGKQLTVRLGKRGKFVGCSGFPACNYTRSLNGEQDTPEMVEAVKGRTCPKCGSGLIIKSGPYGRFIGCSSYPKCKFIEPLNKPLDTGVACPQCKAGNLIERKSRYGKVFYSCSTYPKCTYAIWNLPVTQTCPKCKWPILTLKITKRRGTQLVCPVKECRYSAEAQT